MRVEPSVEQIESFRENGFLVVDRITTDEEIVRLREIFLEIFAKIDARSKKDSDNPKWAVQTFMPEMAYPELLDTHFFHNARNFTAALYDLPVGEIGSWGHMIRKPHVGSRVAPWHQDEAYWEPELQYGPAVGAWLPLHDCPVEMGAMQFIPGSHKWGVLEHDFYDGDPVHNLLQAKGVEDWASTAVACPLTMGGCTFHDKNTLHFTAENTTNETRLAYPIEFQVDPVLRHDPRTWQWVDDMRVAHRRGPITTFSRDGQLVPNGL